MEEKKSAPEKKDVDAQVDLLDKEPIVVAVENTPEPTAAAMTQKANRRSAKLAVIAIVVVVVALLGVLYALEKDGRSDTTIFSGIIAWQDSRSPLVEVNGVGITQADLDQTATQLEQSAQLQGADISSTQVQAEIQAQAIQLLIRTELLGQAAAAEGIVVTDEEVEGRYSEIEVEAGGPEALAERMQQFEIAEETLLSDIQSELTIQKLLEEILSEEALMVTDEEAQAAYDEAAATGAELPPYEEVQSQIFAQLAQTKETALVEEYLQQLEEDADIQINQ